MKYKRQLLGIPKGNAGLSAAKIGAIALGSALLNKFSMGNKPKTSTYYKKPTRRKSRRSYKRRRITKIKSRRRGKYKRLNNGVSTHLVPKCDLQVTLRKKLIVPRGISGRALHVYNYSGVMENNDATGSPRFRQEWSLIRRLNDKTMIEQMETRIPIDNGTAVDRKFNIHYNNGYIMLRNLGDQPVVAKLYAVTCREDLDSTDENGGFLDCYEKSLEQQFATAIPNYTNVSMLGNMQYQYDNDVYNITGLGWSLKGSYMTKYWKVLKTCEISLGPYEQKEVKYFVKVNKKMFYQETKNADKYRFTTLEMWCNFRSILYGYSGTMDGKATKMTLAPCKIGYLGYDRTRTSYYVPRTKLIYLNNNAEDNAIPPQNGLPYYKVNPGNQNVGEPGTGINIE